MANPYTPPRTTSTHDATQSGSTIRSVLAILVGGLLIGFIAPYVTMSALTKAAWEWPVAERLLGWLLNSVGLSTYIRIQATILAAIGGWVAAAVARRDHILHAFLSALLTVILNAIANWMLYSLYDVPPIAIYFIVAMMAGWLVGKSAQPTT